MFELFLITALSFSPSHFDYGDNYVDISFCSKNYYTAFEGSFYPDSTWLNWFIQSSEKGIYEGSMIEITFTSEDGTDGYWCRGEKIVYDALTGNL